MKAASWGGAAMVGTIALVLQETAAIATNLWQDQEFRQFLYAAAIVVVGALAYVWKKHADKQLEKVRAEAQAQIEKLKAAANASDSQAALQQALLDAMQSNNDANLKQNDQHRAQYDRVFELWRNEGQERAKERGEAWAAVQANADGMKELAKLGIDIQSKLQNQTPPTDLTPILTELRGLREDFSKGFKEIREVVTPQTEQVA